MQPLLPTGVTIAHPDRLFIGGEWVAPLAGGAIEVTSPHTEQVCAIVGEAREADMDRAVAAARRAFDEGPWPTMPVAKRAAIVRRMAQVLADRQNELAAAFIAEIGALCTFAPFAVGAATTTLAGYADIGEAYAWETRQPSTIPGHTTILVREPVGVVAAIAPWNMPYAIMVQKIAPALISGCAVIMKPAPETPLEAYILAEAAEAAGVPPGVLNLVTAHREASDHLVRSRGVDKISFTGSTVAGKRIGSVAGERIARVTLELGGKSPAIVLDDFPTEAAGQLLARTITVLSGQVCAMLSRAIVPAGRMDAIADAIAAEMQRVRIGSPLDPNTEMGPIALKRQVDRIEHYVESGKREGAELVTGGRRPAQMDIGYYYEPTLFSDVDNAMTIAREEIFGPVLALIPSSSLDNAIQIANDSDFGLNAAVLSNDRGAAYAVGRRLRAGNVAQNGLKCDFSQPFGGFKQSGVGREGGVEGLTPYIELKAMQIEEA